MSVEYKPPKTMKQLERENAYLCDRITTQKQTIQSYRDESREWREVAERAQAENAKLREQVAESERVHEIDMEIVGLMMHPEVVERLESENAKLREEVIDLRKSSQTYEAENAKLRELVADIYEMAYPEFPSAFDAAFADRMRELGIEVS